MKTGYSPRILTQSPPSICLSPVELSHPSSSTPASTRTILSPISFDSSATKQESIASKVKFLKDLIIARDEFLSMNSKTRSNKVIKDIIEESIHILKLYNIKTVVVKETFRKSHFCYTSATQTQKLAEVISQIVLQINSLPRSFLMKLGIREFIFCDRFSYEGEQRDKTKLLVKEKLLKGVFPLEVYEKANGAITHVRKLFMNFFLARRPDSMQEWKTFQHKIEEFLKLKSEIPENTLFEEWDKFLDEREGVRVNTELYEIRKGKLLEMLNDFDHQGFEAPKNVKITSKMYMSQKTFRD
jgi:hypothetical protein